LEKEENDMFEFKAVQNTANVVVHIARICSKYVPAFLNSGGGRLMFGVEDDGRVVGVPLDRGQRDGIRLAIDSLVVEPDCSHLLELVLSPVIGASCERYVVEVCIRAGEPEVLYCTRAGEHFVRRNSAVYMLKGIDGSYGVLVL
jgi:predicted HTH transcriptional regulator